MTGQHLPKQPLQEIKDHLANGRMLVKRMLRLYTVSRLISDSLELQTVLEKVMDAIIQLTGAERGFLMLLDEGELSIRVARNFDEETLESDAFTISRSVAQEVLHTGRAIVSMNAQTDPRFAGYRSVAANNLTSIMVSPLRIRDELSGVVYVDNRAQSGIFSEDDLHLLALFGEQAAIAIGNAAHVEQRERTFQAQIDQLKIDVARREQQVAEIVESPYFQNLQDKIQAMRNKRQKPSDGDSM